MSIVIPTYNRAHLVGSALDACLSQTCRNLEVIVVNDGSRDGTAAVLDAYARRDPRVRVIHKPNEGIPDTVNRGFAEARGEWLTWTSDDNLYYPEAIETMVAYLVQHPEIALVYTDVREIDAEGSVLRLVDAGEPETLAHTCAVRGCLLFRRAVLERVDPFRRRWVRCHDYDFYRRVWQVFPVAHIPQVLYDYRWHAESMSGNHYAHVIEHAQLLASSVATRAERRAAWADARWELARMFAAGSKPARAAGQALLCACCQPGRARRCWSLAWRAAYGALPAPIPRAWRTLKHTARARGQSRAR